MLELAEVLVLVTGVKVNWSLGDNILKWFDAWEILRIGRGLLDTEEVKLLEGLESILVYFKLYIFTCWKGNGGIILF
jgi:hypothetical protein